MNEEATKDKLNADRARAKRATQSKTGGLATPQPGGGGPSPTQLLKAGGAAEFIKSSSEEALRQSWLNIITSYGLTFLYIIFHFIGYYLGGPLARFFCRPGEEGAFGLIPKKYLAPMKAAGGETEAAEKITESVDAASEYAELTVVGAVCLLLLVIILLIVVLIVVILQVLKII